MNKENLNIAFSANESLIKKYRYYSTTSSEKGLEEINRHLIVTTKRLILESISSTGFSREEIPVNSIEKIETKFFKSKKHTLAILLLVLGLLCNITFVLIGPFFNVLTITEFIGPIITGGLFVIIAILIMILKKPKLAFGLSIYSSREFYQQSSISGYNFKQRRRSNNEKNMRIVSKVTPAALVMLNEINALLIDLRELNNEKEILKNLYLQNKISEFEYNQKYQITLNNVINIYK